VFTVATGLVLLLTAGMSLARHRSPLERAGLGLLWAGGASNLIDRLAHDRVVDFLNVGLGPLRTGIFNVADMAVTAGVLLVLVRQGSKSATGMEHAGNATGTTASPTTSTDIDR